MGSHIKAALKIVAPSIALIGGSVLVGGLGGCAVHAPELTVHTMPDVDERAAAILIANATNTERNGVKLVASDVFGQELHTRYVAYVQRRLDDAPRIAEAPID